MKKKNTIISDWLNLHNNPEIDEQVKKQLEEKTKMSKEIIIVDKPLQDDNTLDKQCINGEYPNWCVRTEGAKVGETFQDWWKRKQEGLGDKILGIYLYDIQPIGGIIGKPNEAALFIRYDYIIVKKQLEEKTKWENLQFPIVKNIPAKSLADSIEGIPTEDMPGKMNEMYQSVFNHAVETINKELNEIRNIEGKEDRIKYLEELLAAWS